MKNTYKLQGNRQIETDREATPVAEWLDEGKRLFGENVTKWRFKCPMCGKAYSVQEFIDAGGEDGPNGAYRECIGRYMGAGSPGAEDGNPDGCNWVAYGFLGIPNGKGRLILAPDGCVVEAFDFDRGEEV